jgi:hypothetical protein
MSSNIASPDKALKLGGILFDIISGKEISSGLSLSTENLNENLCKCGGRGTWDLFVPGKFILRWDCDSNPKGYLYPLPKNARWNTVYSITSNRSYIATFERRNWQTRFPSEEEIAVYNLKTGKELSRLPATQLKHFDKMYSTRLILSEDAKSIVVKTGKNRITRFCASTWNIQMEYADPNDLSDSEIEQIYVCDMESKLLAKTPYGVKLWNLESGKLLQSWLAADQVTAMHLDYPLIILGFDNGVVKISNLTNNKKTQTNLLLDGSQSVQADTITALAYHHPYVYAGSANGCVYVINTQDGEEKMALSLGALEPVHYIILSEDGLRLIVNNVWIFRLFWDYEFSTESAP